MSVPTKTYTHTHTNIYIYIYIYIFHDIVLHLKTNEYKSSCSNVKSQMTKYFLFYECQKHQLISRDFSIFFLFVYFITNLKAGQQSHFLAELGI